MHLNVKKWFANFISGKKAYTENNGKPFIRRHLINEVPQGPVLSPTLFNLYMHDIPAPMDPKMHLMSYANDLTVMSQHSKYETAAGNLQIYINLLET